MANRTPDYSIWPQRSKWFDVAYDLLVLANDCLADTPLGVPKNMYVDVEEPDFNCCDFISVHMQVVRPIQRHRGAFPEENFQSINRCGDLYWVPRYEITVGRPCRPILDPKSTSRPRPASDAARTEYARNIYFDAEMLSCCVFTKISNGYELGGLNFQASQIFPQQVYPETFGECSRMRFRIMFDFNSCCDPEERGYCDDDWATRTLSEGPLGQNLAPPVNPTMIEQAEKYGR